MRAYLSDVLKRYRVAPCNLAERAVWAENEARWLVTKAERINPKRGVFGQTVSLSTLNDGLQCLRGVRGARYSIRTEEAQILVEALTTFISNEVR